MGARPEGLDPRAVSLPEGLAETPDPAAPCWDGGAPIDSRSPVHDLVVVLQALSRQVPNAQHRRQLLTHRRPIGEGDRVGGESGHLHQAPDRLQASPQSGSGADPAPGMSSTSHSPDVHRAGARTWFEAVVAASKPAISAASSSDANCITSVAT